MSHKVSTGFYGVLCMTHDGGKIGGYIKGHVRSLSGFFSFPFFPRFAFLSLCLPVRTYNTGLIVSGLRAPSWVSDPFIVSRRTPVSL